MNCSNICFRKKQRRTAFYQTVSGDEKAEFINGEVICSSPARDKHTVIVNNLSSIFIKFARKNKAGVVRGEKWFVGLHGNEFEPDVWFFRKEIADTFNDDTMFYSVPDFATEVLSDSTGKRDRGVKFVDYALNELKNSG